MSTPALVITAAAVCLLATRASHGAEDHSQHQQQGQAEQQVDHSQHQQPGQAEQQMDHSQHQQHGQTEQQMDHSQHQQQGQAEQQMDHSQHQQPSQQDEHAHHQAPAANEPTESERAHVPPDPPQHVMGDMSVEHMNELMQMEDNAAYGMVLLDQLEWQRVDGADATVWEFDAWYGNDYNKIWFETEGERVDSEEEGRVEVMLDHIITSWWSVQTGVRQDFGAGPTRTWLDLGIQGMAPYFFEIDAALYIGEQGRTSARFSAEYDLLITQRLVLQPEVELRLFGKDDPANGIGSGLSDIEAGLRLRYEIRREFAPYVGLHWERKFGRTATFARHEGEDESDLVFVAGLRAWF